VMALAAKPNPIAAHEAEKAATRERMRRLRSSAAQTACAAERVVTESTTYQTEPPPQAPVMTEHDQEVLPPDPTEEARIDHIENEFQQLSRNGRVRCAARLNKALYS